jgi:hypothetical protein
VRREFHFEDSVADRDSKSNATHHRKVGKIVTDISYCRLRHTGFFDDLFERRNFRWLLLVDEFHFHFIGAPGERGAFAAGDYSRANTRGVRES